jgi:hypothetical protein
VGRGSPVGRQRGPGFAVSMSGSGHEQRRLPMAGPLCGPQRSKQARMSALSRVPVVPRTGPEGQRIAKRRRWHSQSRPLVRSRRWISELPWPRPTGWRRRCYGLEGRSRSTAFLEQNEIDVDLCQRRKPLRDVSRFAQVRAYGCPPDFRFRQAAASTAKTTAIEPTPSAYA